MAHYRAVMGTTIDCEGCKFDGDKCLSDEGCIAFGDSFENGAEYSDKPTKQNLEEWLKQQEPWMFNWA